MKANLDTVLALVKKNKIIINNLYDYTYRNNALSSEFKKEVEYALESIIELENYLFAKEEIEDRLDDLEAKVTNIFQELARISELKLGAEDDSN